MNIIELAIYCGVAIIGLLILYKMCRLVWRLLCGKPKPKIPLAPPLTPDEQHETVRLENLRKQVDAEDEKLRLTEQTRVSIERSLVSKKQDLASITAQIDSEKQRLADAKAEREQLIQPCVQCGADTAGTSCLQCGAKRKSAIIQYVKTPWEDVRQYLFSVAEWGDPTELSFVNGEVLLPWAQKDSTVFIVGGISYDWGKMEDEDNGGNDWWTYLTYDHPVLGEITLINKINSDGDHLYRDGQNNDIELDGGDYSDLRSDYAKAIKQGLTALYLWMKNEQVA